MRALIPGVVLLGLSSAQPAAAQSTDSHAVGPVEVTPFASFGSYPSSRMGAAVTFPWTRNLSVESEIGWRLTSGDLSASAGMLYNLPKIARVTPYVATGVGLAPYWRSFPAPTADPVSLQQTSFTVNAGGGIEIPVTQNWGLRTDARWFNGVAQGAGEYWRLYYGVSFRAGR
jgi:hypothetical protein